MDSTSSTLNMAVVGGMVLQRTASVLEPLVALLLEHGVTYPQLAETLKMAFVKIAEREFTPGLRRVTDSNLAVTTGIHRKEIKHLREIMALPAAGNLDETPQSLTAAVFLRWLTDPRYCEPDGQPGALPRHGGERSFESLVRSISKDVHSRTVLNELARLEMVTEDEEAVRLNADAFVPNPEFPRMLDYLGANLHDHAAAATHNVLAKGPKFLEQSISCEAVPLPAVEEIAALVRQQWTQVRDAVTPEVARHEATFQQQFAAQPADGSSARIRFGMYFFAESNKQSAQADCSH
jgi:hypothetical protein